MFEEGYPSSIAWRDGLASFTGMSVNTAGLYHLNFTTDLDLAGGVQCLSSAISVEIGKPNELIVLR